MIFLTMMNGQRRLINERLIESVKESPDTTVTMLNGKKLIIKENLEEVFDIVLEYNRKVMDFKSLMENKE